MATRQEYCSTQIKSTAVKEFIEAYKDSLTNEEIAKLFKAKNKQQRERIIINQDAQNKRLASFEEALKQQDTTKNQVATNRFTALGDKSAVGLYRTTLFNASGVWHGGAGNSLELKIASTRNKYTQPLLGELEKLDARVVSVANLTKGRYNFATPEGEKFDRNVRIEWGILNGTGDAPTNDLKAKNVAKALNDATSRQIQDAQIMGMQTGLKKGYAGMQSHNQVKISNVSQKEYWDFTLKLLKDEQAEAFSQDAQIRNNLYDALAGRDKVGFSIDKLPLKARENIQAFKNTRSFEFKNVEAEIEYHRRFGDSIDIVDTTFEAINRQAKAMASFSQFGFEEPAVAVQKDINYIWDKHIPQKEKERLQNTANFGLEQIQARLNADVEELIQGTRLPTITKKILGYEAAKTLTGTIVNQASNDAVMRSFQTFLRTGDKQKSLLEGTKNVALAPFNILHTLFKGYKNSTRAGLTKEQYVEMANFGYLADGMQRQMHEIMIKEGTFEVQKASKIDSYINGMAKITHTIAGNFADTQFKTKAIRFSLAKELDDYINGNFKGNKAMYEDFLRIYFKDNEINAIKQLKEAREGDGIHASDIKYLKNEALEPLIQDDINLLIKQSKAEQMALEGTIKDAETNVLKAEILKAEIEAKNKLKTEEKIAELKERFDKKASKFIEDKEKKTGEKIKLQGKLTPERIIKIMEKRAKMQNQNEELKKQITDIKNKITETKDAEVIKKLKLEKKEAKKLIQKNNNELAQNKSYFTEYEYKQLKFIQNQIKTEENKIETNKYFFTKEDFKKITKANEEIQNSKDLKEKLLKQQETFQNDIEERKGELYERKKLELENKLSQMFIAETNRNLNITGNLVKSIAREDGKQLGSLGALFLQLKSSSIGMYFDLYARILNHPHFTTFGKIGTFSSVATFMLLSGMITIAVKDMINNYAEPKKRTIPELLTGGIEASGMGGIIYDVGKALLGRQLAGVFFSERVYDRGALGDIASFALGPAGGDAVALLQATQDLIPQGEDGSIKIDKALNFTVKTALPVANVSFLRALTNEMLAGLGAVIQDATNGMLQSTKQENLEKRRNEEEGLFTGQTPRASLIF